MGINVRRARREDLDSLVNFDLEFGLDTEESARNRFLRVLDPHIKSYSIFVAENDNKIVGYIDYAIRDTETFISGLYVHPDLRGNGVGSRLLLLVKRESELKAKRRIGLVTLGEESKEFYNKWGFRNCRDYGKGGMTIDL